MTSQLARPARPARPVRLAQPAQNLAGSLFKNSLLAFWLLTLTASGFAPLSYSPPQSKTPPAVAESDSDRPEAPSGSDAGAAPKSSKSSVNFWLIAGASSGLSQSTSDRNKRLRERTEFSNSAKLQIWSQTELGEHNREAILKSAEFTLLGLKPSGVS